MSRYDDFDFGPTSVIALNDDFVPNRPRFLGAASAEQSGRPSFSDDLNSPQDSTHNLTVHATQDPASPRLNHNEPSADEQLANGNSEKHPHSEKRSHDYTAPNVQTRRRITIAAIAVGALIVIVLAVALPVYFVVVRPQQLSRDSGASADVSKASEGSNPEPENLPVTGGDGSIVHADDGSTFTYKNSFGGYWYRNQSDPLNNGARAQSYSPPLNQTWDWAKDRIYGVNLGGWFTLEPFISPALFQKYPGTIDEWTLSEAMAADTASGGLSQIEEHYKTFITEQDFAMIAAAGLNWVRIPLPYWAIEVYPGEPFLPKVSWQYFLKAVEWARKYGLRINLDFHALPGSQNAWNHSGKFGSVNMLNGVMGIANAQRSLDYIRILAEFISQSEYKDVIPFFGIVNEARIDPITFDSIRAFYLQAYNIVRNAGGLGQGNGPVVSIHNGFHPLSDWKGYLSGADRLFMDQHPYLAFADQSSDPLSAFIRRPCDWGQPIAQSMSEFGFTAAGEWSNAINDCGLFVNGADPSVGTRFEGNYKGVQSTSYGSCSEWTDYTKWDDERNADMGKFMLTSMDALQNWFFWTWKIGNSATSGRVEAPFWSYKLAIEQGWAPLDPRTADGACAAAGNSFPKFTGTFQPNQVGLAATPTIDPGQIAQFGTWPPPSIGGQDNAVILPTYAPTGPIPTLPPATFTQPDGAVITAGTGWTNPQDTQLMYVPIAGCEYPDAWNAVNATIPAKCPSA